MRHEYDSQFGFTVGGDIGNFFGRNTQSLVDYRNWVGDRTGLNRAVDQINNELAKIQWDKVAAYSVTGGFELFKIFANTGLDKATGGLFTRLSSIDDIALRAVRGEGRPEDWTSLLITALQIAPLITGGSPAVIRFASDTILRGTPLGESELGRSIVATAAMAAGGSGPWVDRIQNSAFEVANKYAEDKIAQSGVISPQIRDAYALYQASASFYKEGKSLSEFAKERSKSEFLSEVQKKTGLPAKDVQNLSATLDKLYSGEIKASDLIKKGYADVKEQLSMSKIADQLQVKIDAISNMDLKEEARKIIAAKVKEESDKFLERKKKELLQHLLEGIRGKRDKRRVFQEFADYQVEVARRELLNQAAEQGRYNPFADPVVVYGSLAILLGGTILLLGRKS